MNRWWRISAFAGIAATAFNEDGPFFLLDCLVDLKSNV